MYVYIIYIYIWDYLQFHLPKEFHQANAIHETEGFWSNRSHLSRWMDWVTSLPRHVGCTLCRDMPDALSPRSARGEIYQSIRWFRRFKRCKKQIAWNHRWNCDGHCWNWRPLESCFTGLKSHHIGGSFRPQSLKILGVRQRKMVERCGEVGDWTSWPLSLHQKMSLNLIVCKRCTLS